MARPKWLDEKETTRSRSNKQEKNIAKDLGGRITVNSGATFSENDIVTPTLDIEAKTTLNKSFIVKEDDIDKMKLKSDNKKTAVMIVEFEKSGKKLVILEYEEFKHLCL